VPMRAAPRPARPLRPLIAALLAWLCVAVAGSWARAAAQVDTPGTDDRPGIADTVVVGSKRFTESYLLGELVRQTLVRAGIPAQHRQGLGNTGILARALAAGEVDVYPEYTGT